jgi:hypothetical protein
MPKISFEGYVPVPHADIERNLAYARGLGLPFVRSVPPHGRRLAVVGGGPSIVGHLSEIRSYTDVWAINGACRWLREHGIESTLLSVDCVPFLAPRVSGATKALLSPRVDPAVFEALAGAEVTLFELGRDKPGGVWSSVCTASVVFQLATELGYLDTTFYGCESSFSEETHAYMNEDELQSYRFVVSCGGREYLTAPDLYMQAELLAEVLRIFPKYFKEESGGLLRAMVENKEHDIVKVSRGLLAAVKKEPSFDERVREHGDYHAALNEMG